MSQQPVESHWDLNMFQTWDLSRLHHVPPVIFVVRYHTTWPQEIYDAGECGPTSITQVPGLHGLYPQGQSFAFELTCPLLTHSASVAARLRLNATWASCMLLSMGTKLALRPRTQKNATDTGVNWFSTGFLMFSQLVSTKIWRERVFLLLVAPGFTFFEVFQLSCWTLIWFNCTCGTLILSHYYKVEMIFFLSQGQTMMAADSLKSWPQKKWMTGSKKPTPLPMAEE